MSMTISYRNSILDRFGFAAYHLPRQPLTLLFTIGFFLFVTFDSGVPAKMQRDGVGIRGVVAFVISEVFLVVVIIGFWTIITLLTMISSKNKPMMAQRTLTLGVEFFVSESSYGRSEIRWPTVQKLARTHNHIFMYLNQESAIVIPRRAFESTAQWDTFYETCKRSVESAA